MDTTTIFLDKYLNDILTKIYANQNLCKYLYYDNQTPLSMTDIADTTVLFTDKDNQKIFTTPFSVDNADYMKSTLTINVYDARVDQGNVFYKDIRVDFHVISHVRLWELTADSGECKLRPNGIVHELNNLFLRQSTVGIGKNQYSYMRNVYPNQWFAGYRYCLSGKDFVLNN